jgi:hypothetical protein
MTLIHFWTCPHNILGNAGVFSSLDDQVTCVDPSGYMELGLVTEYPSAEKMFTLHIHSHIKVVNSKQHA